MVSGLPQVWTVIVLALMTIPLSGCAGTETDEEEDASAPVVQEEADDDADVRQDAVNGATATPRPDTPTSGEDAPATEGFPTSTARTTGGTEVDSPVPTTPSTVSPTTDADPTQVTDASTATQDPTPAATAGTTTATPAPTERSTTTPAATTTTPTPTTTEAPVTAEEEDDEWPREGSFVRYRTTGGASSPGGGFSTSHDADWHLVYTNGGWNGTCTWSRSERVRQYDAENDTYHDEWTNTSGRERVTTTPPRGFTDVTVGDVVEVPYLAGCQEDVFEALTVEEKTVHSAPRQSDGSPSWYGYWNPEWPADAYAYWETESGLVLAWRDQRTNGYDDGWMVDTDAPLT